MVPHDKYLETEIDGIYIAGDCAGIGEASTAMLEGQIAGLSAVLHMEDIRVVRERREELITELETLRKGPFGEKPRKGKEKLFEVSR